MSQVVTGCKVELSINNVKVAFASDASYVYKLNVYDVREIDSLEIAEFAEIGVEVEFTCSMFRINHNSVQANGWSPSLRDLLKQPELTATIYNKHDKYTAITVSGMKLIGRSGTVGARSAQVEQLTFRARLLFDEAGQA